MLRVARTVVGLCIAFVVSCFVAGNAVLLSLLLVGGNLNSFEPGLMLVSGAFVAVLAFRPFILIGVPVFVLLRVRCEGRRWVFVVAGAAVGLFCYLAATIYMPSISIFPLMGVGGVVGGSVGGWIMWQCVFWAPKKRRAPL